MDSQALARASVEVLAALFGGVLGGPSQRAGDELYALVAWRLRSDGLGPLLDRFVDAPQSPEARVALVRVLGRELTPDGSFRTAVGIAVRRATGRTASTPISRWSAGLRRTRAAGNDRGPRPVQSGGRGPFRD